MSVATNQYVARPTCQCYQSVYSQTNMSVATNEYVAKPTCQCYQSVYSQTDMPVLPIGL